jgi:hypothetical protein
MKKLCFVKKFGTFPSKFLPLKLFLKYWARGAEIPGARSP